MADSTPVSQRGLILLAAAGLALGLLSMGLVLASDHIDDRGLFGGLALLVGWSFIGTGLFAWWRRPGNRTGLLMTAAGFAWFANAAGAANDELFFTVGIALDGLFPAVVGHLLMAFPTGRLQTRTERAVIAGVYAAVTVLQVPALLFEDEPRSLLVVEPDQDLSDAFDAMQYLVGLSLIVASAVLLVRRWGAVPAAQRRTLSPVLWTGGAAFAVFFLAGGFDAAGMPVDALEFLSMAAVATVPFGFLAGLLRSRLAAGAAVGELVRRLGQTPEPDALRGALSEALGDPTLTLAYWLPDSERFVDARGRPVTLHDRSWTEVELNGRRIGAIAHDPALADEPQLVRTAGAAAALALENQRLSAELRARIEELRTSRSRLVAAGDAERRRLERNLHDGAQQRLVALSLTLRLAQAKVHKDPEKADELLGAAQEELTLALGELRELARGIHPAILSDRGLGAALEALAGRAPITVDLADLPSDRLPEPIEAAAYFVVAEALTNVVKYAHASQATVSVTRRNGHAVVEVADDGIGGADPERGSGLRGLVDRVSALDGRMLLDSPAGSGTRLRAEIPV